jgi:hypothetical protein
VRRSSPLGRTRYARSPWVRAVLIPLMLAGAASSAHAQQVLLQLRPHAGDTLHMRLDQEMNITRTGQVALGDAATAVTTTWVVLQRMIVERADTSGTEVMQVTDSVSTERIDDRGPEPAPRRNRPVDGSHVLLHVAPDGAVTLLDSTNSVSSALREVLRDLPVTFPRDPVKVGQSWVRAMQLPPGAGYGRQGGEIKLEFRLDSVADGSDLAYVSVHGPLGGARVNAAVGGARVTTRGTLAGTMVIDRRRGWLTDWHATIDVEYDMQPPTGSNQSPGRMRMTATQWLRAIDRP